MKTITIHDDIPDLIDGLPFPSDDHFRLLRRKAPSVDTKQDHDYGSEYGSDSSDLLDSCCLLPDFRCLDLARTYDHLTLLPLDISRGSLRYDAMVLTDRYLRVFPQAAPTSSRGRGRPPKGDKNPRSVGMRLTRSRSRVVR